MKFRIMGQSIPKVLSARVFSSVWCPRLGFESTKRAVTVQDACRNSETCLNHFFLCFLKILLLPKGFKVFRPLDASALPAKTMEFQEMMFELEEVREEPTPAKDTTLPEYG
jgi:hypothetical protein